MRAVVQRVKKATLEVNNAVFSSIDKGLVVMLGVMEGDSESQADFLAKKIAELRIFTDENDKMNLSATNLKADIMVVSNFTLGADCRKGRRPYFVYSAKPDIANVLYEHFVTQLRNDERIGKVSTGQFGEHMEISLVADGPVTICLNTDEIQKK